MTQVIAMSFNIYYQEIASRAQATTQLLRWHNPDVIGLQEVSIDWVQPIRDFLAENDYSHYGYGRYGADLFDEEMNNREELLPLIWKKEKFDLNDSGHFWASSTPDVPCSLAWDDGIAAKRPRCINWVKLTDRQTSKDIVFLNCHLDYLSNEVRSRSAELLVEQMKCFYASGIPVLMMGDFNFGLESDGYSVLTKNGYNDARQEAPQTTDSGSFNDWGKRTKENYAIIDHFFITPGITAHSFEVIDDMSSGEYISDHFPILTRITF